MTYASLRYPVQLSPFDLIWSVTSHIFLDCFNHYLTLLLVTVFDVGHSSAYPLVTLDGDVFAFRGGQDPIFVSVGQYDVPTCLQHGDGDEVSDTFFVDSHLEVTVCSLHFVDRSSGVTSAGCCGVTFLDICQ